MSGSLIEIVVAVALLGGPLLAGVTLVQSGTRGVSTGLERGVAGSALADLAERLIEQPAATLAEVAGKAKPERAAWLDAQLADGADGLPPDVARMLAASNVALAGRLDLGVEPVDGVPGLARLTITAELADGATRRVTRLWRSEAARAAR